MDEKSLVGLFGLGGALVGGCLSIAGNWWIETVRRRNEQRAAATVLAAEIESILEMSAARDYIGRFDLIAPMGGGQHLAHDANHQVHHWGRSGP